MKAMLIKKYGSPDEFYFGETETPKIKKDEILIKVSGSSVNPVDTHIRRGHLKSFVRLKMPAILGIDVSGVVADVGSSVTKFRKGDRVYALTGIMRNGAYGEFIAIPESAVAMVPGNLNLTAAGVVPGSGMTAYEAFSVHALVAKGMDVLINGASGGVGTFAVQVAKSLGANVTAVCSTERIALVEQLGADEVIDYRKQNLFDTIEQFDVILNCVVGIGFRKLAKLLKPGGRSLIITGNPFQIPLIKLLNLFSSRKTISFFVKADGKILEGLSNLIKSGGVKPVIEKTYSWKELPQAHRHVESGKIGGKIGISMT